MQKQIMNDLLLRSRVVVRTSNLKISRRRFAADLREMHLDCVQHDFPPSFSQSHHSSVALFFVLAGAVSSSRHHLMFKALQPHLARQNFPARGQRGSNLAKILGQ